MATPAKFLLSATAPAQFPPPGLPEVAFLGRSNVGKSTLLNTLIGRKMAFTSNTPGRTQAVNFFEIDGRMLFVDLPGYGFAKAPKSVSRGWQEVIDSYLLDDRKCLKLCVLLLDSRRGWMEIDIQLKEWLEFHQRPYMVVATKVDKLNQKEKNASQKAIRERYPSGSLLWFSGLSGQGVKEIWQTIWKTTAQ
ncbi:MAG: YihA family ribosome biogenesis GTP-binding protein [Acidobacteria bacterium]|nr:YihA family ribosome biogenesis GTP-binding protein [Acidobacteriota bacterium]